MKPHKRKLFIALLLMFVLIVGLTFWANSHIVNRSKDFLINDISKVVNTKVGLLLGTSKNLPNGNRNAYFYHRIDAAVQLFEQNKIKYIIVSGDNSIKDYNEPLDMKNELISRGVPAQKIFMDFAGFRTFDSVIRANKVFGQDTFLVISQEFHNERAVFIARKNGLVAFGYNAKNVSVKAGFKTKLREYFARNKVFLDQWFNTNPKFLGEKVVVE
ncbi:MAG: ElyC/SanA/YdcF family protein [Bacteroidota bacterium]|nr:ElyC/SanA/YdcF family protein [Bacteroidota bacterium]